MQTLEENRVKLVKKYGTPNKDQNSIGVGPENVNKFYTELNELMGITIELDFEPIPLSEFGNIEISATDIVRLDNKIIKCEKLQEEKTSDEKVNKE